MIRPITVATFLLACGSGLYLYQEKHEVQLLDRTIEKTVHDTASLREQSRVLAAEWTMLNDPERLRQYSDKYLGLKAIVPPQFTNLAGLDTRLPPVTPETPPESDQPIASADGTAQPDGDADNAPIASADLPPRPPLPPATPPVSTEVASGIAAPTATVQRAASLAQAEPATDPAQVASRPAERKVAEVHRSTDQRTSDLHPIDLRPTESRVADAHAADSKAVEPRTAEAHPSDARGAAPRWADARPSDTRPSEIHPSETHWAETRPTEPRIADSNAPDRRVADARPLQAQQRPPMRVASERPVSYGAPPYGAQPYRAPRGPAPIAAAPTAVSAPYNGSLLGMARTAPPAPRPMPVNATNWYNAN
jgi:hypothetical protein